MAKRNRRIDYAIAARVRVLRARQTRELEPVIRRFFAAQAARVVVRLDRVMKSAASDAALLMPPEEDALFYDAVRAYLERGLITAAELAALIAAQPMTLTREWIQAYLAEGSTRIVRINETTREAIRGLLVDAEQAGYSTYQIAHGVADDAFRGVQSLVEEFYRNRAEAIARTEMGMASQRAAIEQWREVGVKWQDIIDGDDWDDECAARNGTRVSIDEPVDLLHPNCTVVSLPVIDENVGAPVNGEPDVEQIARDMLAEMSV